MPDFDWWTYQGYIAAGAGYPSVHHYCESERIMPTALELHAMLEGWKYKDRPDKPRPSWLPAWNYSKAELYRIGWVSQGKKTAEEIITEHRMELNEEQRQWLDEGLRCKLVLRGGQPMLSSDTIIIERIDE